MVRNPGTIVRWVLLTIVILNAIELMVPKLYIDN